MVSGDTVWYPTTRMPEDRFGRRPPRRPAGLRSGGGADSGGAAGAAGAVGGRAPGRGAVSGGGLLGRGAPKRDRRRGEDRGRRKGPAANAQRP